MTDQDNKRETSIINSVKIVREGHEAPLNSTVHTYRHFQKEIERLRKKAQFDEPFSMHGVTAK